MPDTEYGPGPTFWLNEEVGGLLRMALFVPERYADHQFLDLIVWHQPRVELDTLPNAVYHARCSLFTNQPQQWLPVLPSGLVPPRRGFPDGSCWDDSSDPELQGKPYFFVEFRFVKVGTGGGEQRSRIFAGGFSLITCDAETTDWDHLEDVGIIESLFHLFERDACGIRQTGN